MKNWILVAVCLAAAIVAYTFIFPVTALIIVVATPFLPNGWYGMNIFVPFILYFVVLFVGAKMQQGRQYRKNKGMYVV